MHFSFSFCYAMYCIIRLSLSRLLIIMMNYLFCVPILFLLRISFHETLNYAGIYIYIHVHVYSSMVLCILAHTQTSMCNHHVLAQH